MFFAALFTRAKRWRQCKYPSVDEWIKKMWYIHTVEQYSDIKKNEIMPFVATWMDLEIIRSDRERQISYEVSEVSQTERDKYYMILLICGI